MPHDRRRTTALAALVATACAHAPVVSRPSEPSLRDRYPAAIGRFDPPPAPAAAIDWRADVPTSARDSVEWERWIGSGWLAGEVEQLRRRWRLPGGIRVQLTACRPFQTSASATWSLEERTIRVCYEYLSEMRAMAQSAERPSVAGQAPDTMPVTQYREHLLTGMARFALQHEVGHMLVGVFKLPITGREEDFADQFALLQLLGDAGAARELLDGPLWHFGYLRSTRSHRPDDTHGSPAQRMANWACWLIGRDAVAFAHLAEWADLSGYRRSRCPSEFELLHRAISTITAPHRR